MGAAASVVKPNRNLMKAGTLLPAIKLNFSNAHCNIEPGQIKASDVKELNPPHPISVDCPAQQLEPSKNDNILQQSPMDQSDENGGKTKTDQTSTCVRKISLKSPPSFNVASDFRKRRLSVASKRTSWRAAPTSVKPASTLFQSQEIGAYFDVSLPFSDEVVGSYSCHGIEPSYYANDGVAAKINQDRGCIIFPLEKTKKQVVFSVLDGHGEHGEIVSHFVMNGLCSELNNNELLESDPFTVLTNVFVRVNENLRMVHPSESIFSGTTCVCVYMKEDRMVVANAGDSRAVLAKQSKKGKYSAHPLTIDQNPDNPMEKARIERLGGFVSPPPEPGLSSRVWLDKEMTQVGLAMARSIGDFAVKSIGVIAEPVVSEYIFESDDSFIIIASDGVWEFMSNEEAVETVAKHLENGFMNATQALIETSAQKWVDIEGDYRDDITAIVVRIPCFTP